jgi:small conductance mechanosensitive channel
MQTVVNTLLKKEFTLPADIVELKIYQEGHPIPLSIKELKDQKKNT